MEEQRVRLGVLEDYGPDAAGDKGEDILPFGQGFDVAPAAVIFAGVTNAVFAVDLAAEKAATTSVGNFVVGPSSFVGTVAASSSLLGKGVDSRTVAPKSVREAMLRDDFDAPFGWKFAMDKEVERVQSHKASAHQAHAGRATQVWRCSG